MPPSDSYTSDAAVVATETSFGCEARSWRYLERGGGGGVLGRITGLTDTVGRAAVQLVKGVNQRTPTSP